MGTKARGMRRHGANTGTATHAMAASNRPAIVPQPPRNTAGSAGSAGMPALPPSPPNTCGKPGISLGTSGQFGHTDGQKDPHA